MIVKEAQAQSWQCHWYRTESSASAAQTFHDSFSLLTLVPSHQGIRNSTQQISSRKPKVRVFNSTHLNVSWHGLFTGCTGYDVGSTTIEIEHKVSDATDMSQTFPADFETKEALVELNPCLGYKIYIRIHSNDGVSQRDSTIIKYNDMIRPNIEQL